MLEKDLEERLVQLCKVEGWACLKLEDKERPGYPVRTIICPDHDLEVRVELKRSSKERLSRRQVQRIVELTSMGREVIAGHDVDSIMSFLKEKFPQ